MEFYLRFKDVSMKFYNHQGNKLFNIPSTDPYLVDYAEAEHSTGNSNFNLKSSLKNTKIRGLATSTRMTRAASKFDKKFAIKSEVKTDNLEIYGDYTMFGQILVLPIRGEGKANITMYNVTGIIDIRGEYFDKDGETYINVTMFKITLKSKNASFLFENIFKGDPVLSATINNFMNENWELVINTLLPGYEQRLGERFRVISNNIFHRIPMKMIFPE